MPRPIHQLLPFGSLQSGSLTILSLLPFLAQAAFFDVTDAMGLDTVNKKSFGNPTWVDFDNDGWLDLLIPRHSQGMNFYKNDGSGTFHNITDNTGLPVGTADDRHGWAWADYDNDGDNDFFAQYGAFSGSIASASRLWRNEGSEQFIDVTDDSGISSFGRTVNWLDYNNDGKLDLLLLQELSATLYRQNDDHSFTDVTIEAGLDQTVGNFMTAGSVADFDMDGDMDVYIGGGQRDQLFQNDGTGSFTKIFLSNHTHSKGMAWGDYDNDGDLDLFVSRGTSDYYQAMVSDETNITFARAIFPADSPEEITFKTTGQNVTFHLIINQNPSLTGINIGVEKAQPLSNPFTLQSATGQPTFTPGAERKFYVWQDDTDTWHIEFSNNGGRRNFYGVITSDGQFTDVNASYTPFLADKPNHLFRNDGVGVFTEVTAAAGIDISANNYSAIWGDYDNDEDIDLYVTNVGNIKGNKANHLFTNNGDGTFTDLALSQNVDAVDAVGRHYGAAWGDYDNDGALDLVLSQGFGWGYPGSLGKERLYRNEGNANHWLKINLIGVQSNRTGMGAHVMVQTDTTTQWRHNNGGGGGQLYSQGGGPLHFGLGDNTKAKKIMVKWPSGIIQQVWQVPGDQAIDIIEQVKPTVMGKPNYQTGGDEGVFVWKDSFDGPYHLRVSGSGTKTSFDIKVVSTEPVDATPFELESNDQWSQTTYGFSLLSGLTTWHDGADFKLSPGAKALFSIVQDGAPNPRQAQFGRNNMSLPPAGWILASDLLPVRPPFPSNNEPGLFVGYDSTNTTLEARYSSNGIGHRSDMSLISSKALLSTTLLSIEDDKIEQTASSVDINGYVANGWDGVDVALDTGSDVGITYTKDDFFQPLLVNSTAGPLGEANAYWLPQATPYGAPDYDPATETKLLLWMNKATGKWHLQATAGGGAAYYQGVLVSDQAFTGIVPNSLEGSNVLDNSVATQIAFELRLSSPWQDGFEFEVPDGANVQLYLEQRGAVDPIQVMRIGAEQWPIEQSPVDISGW